MAYLPHNVHAAGGGPSGKRNATGHGHARLMWAVATACMERANSLLIIVVKSGPAVKVPIPRLAAYAQLD